MNTPFSTQVHDQESLIAKLQVLEQKRNSLYPRQAAGIKLQRLLETLRHLRDYPELATRADALLEKFSPSAEDIFALAKALESLDFSSGSAHQTQMHLLKDLKQVGQTFANQQLEEDMGAVRRIAQTIRDSLGQGSQPHIAEEAQMLEDCSEHDFFVHLESLIALIHESISRRLLSSEPILLVEDDPEMAKLLKKHLDSQGYTVEHAGNASVFHDKVQEQPFSLVLMDVSLPDADGRNLLVELKQQGDLAHIPVMIMSGRGSSIRAECLALGADQVFDKPLDLHALTAAVSERLKTKRLMESQAFFDPLTGLPNRAALYQNYRRYLALAQRHNKPLSIGILDIDHFKLINDTWGHPAGDKVLRDLSTLLAESLRESDVVARWGGEEFVLLLPDTPLQNAWQVIDSLREKVAAQAFETPDGHGLNLNFSGGVASVRLRSTLEESVARADHALYTAKQEGRNCVVAQPENGFGTEPPIRLIIADDDALVLSSLRHFFQTPPFTLETLSKQLPDLAVLQEHPPALLLLEICSLQREDFAWLKALRKNPHFHAVPVLVLAGYGHQVALDTCLNLGVDDYILKPFSPSELQARILRLLQTRHPLGRQIEASKP